MLHYMHHSDTHDRRDDERAFLFSRHEPSAPHIPNHAADWSTPKSLIRLLPTSRLSSATSWAPASSLTRVRSPTWPSTPRPRSRSSAPRRLCSARSRPRATPPSTVSSSTPPSSARLTRETKVASRDTSPTSAQSRPASTASPISRRMPLGRSSRSRWRSAWSSTTRAPRPGRTSR